MDGKITLITPPDFYENSNISILFAHLNSKDQEVVGKWLSNLSTKENINIYFYNGEVDVAWFLYAVSRCDYKYIDLDDVNYISNALSGYIIGKNDVCYKTSDVNISSVYSHINANRVTTIEDFLERITIA